MFDGQDGFPFVIGGSMTSVTEWHPPAVQIFQLWQIYLDNVNPLLKLTHTPTLQGQLIEAAANPAKIPKPLEALLFSIYFMAIVSLTDEEVQDTFKEEKTRLMSKYHRGTQQALINAGFMRSPDIVVLQAFLMYLVSPPLRSSRPHLPPPLFKYCLHYLTFFFLPQKIVLLHCYGFLTLLIRLACANLSTHEPCSV